MKVAYSQNFGAVIHKDGATSRLQVKSEFFYQNQLNKFQDGEEVTLVIHNRKPKRSDQQNAYYWGVYLPIIAEETGERDTNRLHELFKGKFLTEGIEDVLGEKVRIKKSTTKLSKADFSKYIMAIEEFTGIQSPPTENYQQLANT